METIEQKLARLAEFEAKAEKQREYVRKYRRARKAKFVNPFESVAPLQTGKGGE
jgi:hypothetical protein